MQVQLHARAKHLQAVVSQIGVCLILLVLTGILLPGSSTYQNMDPGYRAHGIVYPLFIGRTDPTVSARLAPELATAPWVDEVAATIHLPLRVIVQVP